MRALDVLELEVDADSLRSNRRTAGWPRPITRT
jgi:hypothetical protein